MTFSLLPGLVFIVLSGAGAAPPDDVSPALSSLVRTEREFAATSLREGIRASFMKYFADDGITLSPKPHVWKKSAAKSPPPANPLARTLYWEPILADVASSGDLGYTMGPSSYKDGAAPDTSVRYGFFFSVWKKQKDGNWRVALDVGSGSTQVVEQYFGQKLVPAVHDSFKSNDKTSDRNAIRRELLALEKGFSKAAAKGGAASAYQNVLDVHAGALREGLVPFSGRDAILAYLVNGTAVCLPEPMNAGVSGGGDLGYTYGAYRESVKAKGPSGFYARVWRKNAKGKWLIVFEVASPTQ